MAHRIIANRIGGPEVLEYEAFNVGEPGHGQVRLRQEAAGVNFVDTQFRGGIYPAPFPLMLGVEGAGVIDAIGMGVPDYNISILTAEDAGIKFVFASAGVQAWWAENPFGFTAGFRNYVNKSLACEATPQFSLRRCTMRNGA